MPDYNALISKISEILAPFLKEGMTLTEDSELVAELGLTSLQVMELVEHIEDEFDISFPLNLLPDIRTVRDLAQRLEEITNP